MKQEEAGGAAESRELEVEDEHQQAAADAQQSHGAEQKHQELVGALADRLRKPRLPRPQPLAALPAGSAAAAVSCRVQAGRRRARFWVGRRAL